MSKEINIAVIGLGLIGGSILKSLRPINYNLIAVSRSEETLQKAIRLNIANEYSTRIESVKLAKIVFICAPINKIISVINDVRKIVNSDCIITDVASLKEFIMDHVNSNDFSCNFIGGHPMAGTEHKGIENASDNLFEGAKWVLTPSKWTASNDVARLEELIHYLGAKTIIADPIEHDKAVALISHMPLFLSQALFGLVSNYPDISTRELALKLAASGFRDTTRLAGTNPELAKDILLMNKLSVREALVDLSDYISKLYEYLDTDEEKFIDFIEKISPERRNMYSSDGKNNLF